MKKSILFITVIIILVGIFSSCGKNKEVKITCSICNGAGEVKYYYGDGENDYNLGPCTSCDGKGFIMVTPIGDSNGGKRVVCGSCYKYVDNLITKKDATGENRTWCEDCWEEYDNMMGR